MQPRLLRLTAAAAALVSTVALAESPRPVLSRSSRRTGLAVVAGIEKYRGNLPPATNAANDARVFTAFCREDARDPGLPHQAARQRRGDVG